MNRWMFAAALALAVLTQQAFLTQQVFAADLPVAPPRAPAYVPVVAPVYNWGGFYIGINGGYGVGQTEWSDPFNSAAVSSGTFDASGFLVGGTIGANYQTSAFVFGVEGDGDASWMQGKTSNAYCSALGLAAGTQCETQNTWLSTIRARAGYAMDRVLLYATGGGAFGNIQAGTNNNWNSSTKFGWTVGGGVEVAFTDNWTARVEYLFVDLQNATCSNGPTCGVDGAAVASQTVKFDANLIRLGVDYKFR